MKSMNKGEGKQHENEFTTFQQPKKPFRGFLTIEIWKTLMAA